MHRWCFTIVPPGCNWRTPQAPSELFLTWQKLWSANKQSVTHLRANAQMHLPCSCMRDQKPCATTTVSLNQVPTQGISRGKWRILCLHTLKRELLFSFVDRMVDKLEQRFCSVDSGLQKSIQICSPKCENFLSESKFYELTKHYSIDQEKEEVLMTRNILAQKTEAGCSPKDILPVHNLLDSDMFPSLKATIQVALTVPVSRCLCERSFSALRQLLSWLCQTVGQKRFHSLAVMWIEKGELQHLSPNLVGFATLENRWHFLMLPSTKWINLVRLQL